MGRVHGVLDLWIYFSNLWFVNIFLFFNFQIPILIFISEISAWRLVFWNSIHMEVASGPFCFLVHSSWLLVFVLCVFELFFSFLLCSFSFIFNSHFFFVVLEFFIFFIFIFYLLIIL